MIARFRTALERVTVALAVAAGIFALATSARAADTIRIAFPDVATVEYMHLLVALERAKERGVNIEFIQFKSEDLATQAVVNGDADVGVGSPFALIQKVKAPIRIFMQLSQLRFYVIVDAATYKSWKDLDGQEVAVHARGSGTEAVMKLMAERNGIKYSRISYVPGSEVRAGAMLQGNIKATVVDSINRDLLMEKAPGRFALLQVDTTNATNDALYANQEFLKEHAAAIDILVESILETWREVTAKPESIADLRQKFNLLPDLTAEVVAEMVPYYKEATKEKTFPVNGGNRESARNDLSFYAVAGQIEGDPAALDVNDFWDFGPLERALQKLGAAQ